MEFLQVEVSKHGTFAPAQPRLGIDLNLPRAQNEVKDAREIFEESRDPQSPRKENSIKD